MTPRLATRMARTPNGNYKAVWVGTWGGETLSGFGSCREAAVYNLLRETNREERLNLKREDVIITGDRAKGWSP